MLLLFIFLDAGIRRSEILNLRLKDLDLGLVTVVGKESRIGTAPFAAATAASMRDDRRSGKSK